MFERSVRGRKGRGKKWGEKSSWPDPSIRPSLRSLTDSVFRLQLTHVCRLKGTVLEHTIYQHTPWGRNREIQTGGEGVGVSRSHPPLTNNSIMKICFFYTRIWKKVWLFQSNVDYFYGTSINLHLLIYKVIISYKWIDRIW